MSAPPEGLAGAGAQWGQAAAQPPAAPAPSLPCCCPGAPGLRDSL